MTPNKQLTKNFSLYEFLYSETGERHGYHEQQYSPPDSVVSNLQELCDHVLQPLRDLITDGYIHINSGYRTPETNKAIGGSAKNSQHLTGQAADISLIRSGMQHNGELFRMLADQGFTFDQLISEMGSEDNPAWVHVSFNPSGNNRMQILRKTSSGYIPYK